ncbi:MAG: CAP domain-containing protein [bacterium]|nr:CAP domain-containing protein [bacterium]
MKKKLVSMMLSLCMLLSTVSVLTCVKPYEVRAEEVAYIYYPTDSKDVSDSTGDDGNELPAQIPYDLATVETAEKSIKQLEKSLNDFNKELKKLHKELDKSKKNFDTIKKYYKQTKATLKNLENALGQADKDLNEVRETVYLIDEYLEPEMHFEPVPEELAEQARKDRTQTKDFLQQARETVKSKKDKVTIATRQFEKATNRYKYAKKIKNSKTIKTKQKLDTESIEFSNKYDGYEDYVKYGIYDNAVVRAEIKAFNEYRAKKKLPKVKLNQNLSKAAAMLALEYTVGADYIVDGVIVSGSQNHIRPDGSRYTTALKECGVKNFSYAPIICIKYSNRTESFMKHVTEDYRSWYDFVVDSKKIKEFGMGYYATSDGSLETWILLPIEK